MRFVKGANSSRAGFKAKHKAENQDNGILLPFWSMEKKIHFFSSCFLTYLFVFSINLNKNALCACKLAPWS